MRVEVEVYKGPLSKEPAIQFSELLAVAEDAERALQVLYANMTVSAIRLGCTSAPARRMCIWGGKRQDCEIDKQIEQQPSSAIRDRGQSTTSLYYDTLTIQGPAQRGDYRITIPEERIDEEDRFIFCNTLAQLLIDARDVMPDFNLDGECKISDPGNSTGGLAAATNCLENQAAAANCLESLTAATNCLGKLSRFGARLERRASYWASENIATMPGSKRLRIEMANFAQFAKDYGNQLIARSDALMKQVAGEQGAGIARDQLANSVFLRDSSPTAYLNLYRWNDAAVSRGDATGRTRMVEQLVADTYWSNINTVFAAGQGDVSMALVKDDIGNWNLKSFDNSPGELLQAYKNVGLAAVKSAVVLAGDGNNLDRAENALNFANQIALGSTSLGRASETRDQLEAIRLDTARQIMTIGAVMQARHETLSTEIEELKYEIGDESSGLVKTWKEQRDELTVAASEEQRLSEEIDRLENEIASVENSIHMLESELVNQSPESELNSLSELDASAPSEEARQAVPPPEDPSAQDEGSAVELRAKLAAQAMQLRELTVSYRETFDLLASQQSRVADARTAFDLADSDLKTKQDELAGRQVTLDALVEGTGEQIQQLLHLHGAVIDRMTEGAAKQAGSAVPEGGT